MVRGARYSGLVYISAIAHRIKANLIDILIDSSSADDIHWHNASNPFI